MRRRSAMLTAVWRAFLYGASSRPLNGIWRNTLCKPSLCGLKIMVLVWCVYEEGLSRALGLGRQAMGAHHHSSSFFGCREPLSAFPAGRTSRKLGLQLSTSPDCLVRESFFFECSAAVYTLGWILREGLMDTIILAHPFSIAQLGLNANATALRKTRREMTFMVDSAFDSKFHKFVHLLSFDRYGAIPPLPLSPTTVVVP